MAGGAGGRGSGEDAAEAEAKQKEMEEARKSMLKSILSPEAFDRCAYVWAMPLWLPFWRA